MPGPGSGIPEHEFKRLYRGGKKRPSDDTTYWLLVIVVALCLLFLIGCDSPVEPQKNPYSNATVCQAWPEPKGTLCCSMGAETCTFFREPAE